MARGRGPWFAIQTEPFSFASYRQCIHRSVLPPARCFEQDVVGGTRLGPGLQVNGIGASGGVHGAGGEVDEGVPMKEVR